jgi:polyisoprenoid-binding protein YceI
MSTYKLDGANHSVASFAVPYVGSTFKASFAPLDATLELDNGSGSLTGSVPASGLTVRNDDLRGHMLSGDFFDAENAPELTFKSSELRRDGDKLTVKGELSARGATVAVEATGTITGPHADQFGQTRMSVVLEGTVDRTKLGMNWNADTADGPALANDVRITADLFFVEQS